MKKNQSPLFFAISLITFCAGLAEAATVKQVKGNKILVELEGEQVEVNQEFFLIDSQTGKKKAIAIIRQVKGSKAVAEVTKGKAEPEQGLLPRNVTAKKSSEVTEDSNVSASRKTSFQRRLTPSWGINGGYLMSSMSAKYTLTAGSGSSNMSGSQFTFGAFYTHPIDEKLAITAYSALETFAVKGTASGTLCNQNTDPNCSVNLNYLSFYGHLKYYFNLNQIRPWGGAGGGLLLKTSGSSNVLKPPTMNQVITVTGGVDWQLSRTNYVPIWLEYNLFPPTTTVTASILAIKAGYSWNF